MDTVTLGYLLKKIRISRGLTINQLAKGICSSRNISYIESGKVTPGIYTLELLLEKLNFENTNDLLIYSTYKNPTFVYDSLHKITDLKNQNEFYKLSELINTLRKNTDFKRGNTKIFLDWHEGICLNIIQKDYDAAIKMFEDCLSFSISDLLENEKGFHIQRQEIEILNSYSICLSLKGENSLSIDIMKAVDAYLSIKILFNNINIFHLKLMYNLTKTLMRENRYEEALEYTIKGIKMSHENNNSQYLGLLYYQKADCYFNLGMNKNITKNLVYAYMFFDMQEKQDFKKIVLDKAEEKFKVDLNPYVVFPDR